LIVVVLGSDDADAVGRGRTLAYFLLENGMDCGRGRGIREWKMEWRHSICPESLVVLEEVWDGLNDRVYPIFATLNGFRKSTVRVQKNLVQDTGKAIKRSTSVAPLNEEEIANEILTILRGGRSFVLSLNNGALIASQPIAPGHEYALSELIKMAECLRLIRESRDKFQGSIGNDVRMIIDEEYKRFTDAVSSVDETSVTILSILATLNGQIRDTLTASALICEAIAKSDSPSTINILVRVQDYGLGTLTNISSRMINVGIEHILRFISDWTLYGILNDPHSEFFIRKHQSKLDGEFWWSKKYTIVEALVPSFLIEKSTLTKILSSGKAHNFLRKFKASCIDYVKNFGSTAPFAVTFETPKSAIPIPDQNLDFRLSQLSFYTSKAMDSLMYLMKTVIFIPGHLKVLQDFILFQRGDFANLLYQRFTEGSEEDAETLVLHSIKSVTNSYCNKVTNERLTDRIDLSKRFQFQPKVNEISLIYLVNPPITTFLGKEMLQKYYRVQKLVWRVKCVECQLIINWRNARRVRLIQKLGIDYKSVCLTRHLTVVFVRTVMTYLSEDVVLISESVMGRDFGKCEDFDEMMLIHSERVEKLMNGAFQSAGYSVFLKGLLAIFRTIDEFLEVEESIESIFVAILEIFEKKKMGKDEFVQSVGDELRDVIEKGNGVKERFKNEVNDFYKSTCVSVEMDGLSSRLHWLRNDL
jgi:hypothetical protein